MQISGISVERKLPLQTTLFSKGKEEERPFSSEFKILNNSQKQYAIVPRHRKEGDRQIKYKSQNKILHKNHDFNLNLDNTNERKVKKNPTDLKKKIPAFRSQQNNKTMQVKFDIAQKMKLTVYYRYYPISILSACGVKEDFMKFLSEEGQFRPLTPFKKPNYKGGINELWHKMIKIAQLKGKYKYRERFNYAYSPQLKAIGYKRKQFKRRKDSDSSSSEEEEIREKARDMETWKKTMGVDGKVFIIRGRYPDLKAALLERGWVENHDKKSNFYDLKWTTKISHVNFDILKPNQMVNHFDNNACLTSKYGICKSLRSVVYSENIDIDRFFPKAYDLTDLGDFENFLQVFKQIYCQSLLKRYLYLDEEINIEKVKVAILVTERRLCEIQNKVSSSLTMKFSLCSINEWNFLKDKPCNREQIIKKINKIFGDSLKGTVEGLLNKLKFFQPQFDLNGYQNIWIAKPAFLSRGRGIRCLRKFSEIIDLCMGKDTQYVIQKYIQNPLIINKRKFDIRIWVLIEDYSPPKIWFFNQFYIRFCLQEYDTSELGNRYAHLTNNSISKNNPKFSMKDMKSSMWTRQDFKNYIQDVYGEGYFKTIVSKMKQIIISTIIGTADQVHGRRGSFQLIGYDMMIDDRLNPWLIEVNSSPAMDYSTPVTEKLVKMVMEDIVKVVVDLRRKKSKKKAAGEFRCIYSGENFQPKNYRIQLPE